MNLIFRFFRYLLLSIFHLLIVVIAAIFHYLLVALTAIFHFALWPFLIAVFRVLFGLLFLSFTATVTGPFQFSDRLAGEWAKHIHTRIDNRDHMYEIFQLCRFIVGAIIVLGWIIATVFTLIILRVVFGTFI